MIRRGIRAWVTHHPWNDCLELRLVADAGYKPAPATRIEKGKFVYEVAEEDSMVEPILTLGEGEVDALLEALKQYAKPVDATVDALRDSRDVRDRLLSLIERRGLR